MKPGFTMIEVLIAMAILAITASAIVVGLTTADKLNRKRIAHSEALVIANNEIETIRLRGSQSNIPEDSSYTVVVNSRLYNVLRTTQKNENVSFANELVDSLVCFSIIICTADLSDTIEKFRVAQGFNR